MAISTSWRIARKHSIIEILNDLGFKENYDFIAINVAEFGGQTALYSSTEYVNLYGGHRLDDYYLAQMKTNENMTINQCGKDELDKQCYKKDREIATGILGRNNGLGAAYKYGEGVLIVSPNYDLIDALQEKMNFIETGLGVPLSNGEVFYNFNTNKEKLSDTKSHMLFNRNQMNMQINWNEVKDRNERRRQMQKEEELKETAGNQDKLDEFRNKKYNEKLAGWGKGIRKLMGSVEPEIEAERNREFAEKLNEKILD